MPSGTGRAVSLARKAPPKCRQIELDGRRQGNFANGQPNCSIFSGWRDQAAGSVFLLFTYSSRRRLFINRSFFEQLAKRPSARRIHRERQQPPPCSTAASSQWVRGRTERQCLRRGTSSERNCLPAISPPRTYDCLSLQWCEYVGRVDLGRARETVLCSGE
jgi:hypothetical protein